METETIIKKKTDINQGGSMPKCIKECFYGNKTFSDRHLHNYVIV